MQPFIKAMRLIAYLYSSRLNFGRFYSLFHLLMVNTVHSARSISLHLAKKSFAVSIVPIFGFFSFFILPDSGLVLSLSLLLWAANKITRANHISLTNAFTLGIGLGIGLLTRYPISPLDSGILVGILLDLALSSELRWSSVFKMMLSVVIGLIIALPLFLGKINYHFTSFLFQMPHNFNSTRESLLGSLIFIGLSTAYLTIWLIFKSIKPGIGTKTHFYIIIPVYGLSAILLISILHAHALPHWLSLTFWLLIPYSIMSCNPKKETKTMRQLIGGEGTGAHDIYGKMQR